MKIGKFEVDVIYDVQCCKCNEYRSNIHFYGSIYEKPTIKRLKAEGWEYVEGVGQLCPECSKRRKNGNKN